MNCYFCGDLGVAAQGQCRTDGRFICRAHSLMREGVLVCIECALGQEGILKAELEDLGQIARSTCRGCGRRLVRDVISNRAFYLALNNERRAKVDALFSYEFDYCPNGCLTCLDCQKHISPTVFSSKTRQCLACGKKH